MYISSVFLDVSQAFDKICPPGLLYKLKKRLPFSHYLFLKSFVNERYFAVRFGSELSSVLPILAAYHTTGNYSFPTHYNLYSADQLIQSKTIVSEYADSKIIYASHPYIIIASSFVKNHLNLLSSRYSLWRIKKNESKSIYTISH